MGFKPNQTYPKDSQTLKQLLSNEELAIIVQEMAQQIVDDYRNQNVALVCVDYGARPFYNLLVDNVRALGKKDIFQGYVRVQTDATKKDGEKEKSRFVYESGILCDKNKLKQTHVIFVDDQINKGRTWDLIKKRYSDALSVELASLIVRPNAKKRMKTNDVKYYGIIYNLRNKTIAGFGMDVKEVLRQGPLVEVPRKPSDNFVERVSTTPHGDRYKLQPHDKNIRTHGKNNRSHDGR